MWKNRVWEREKLFPYPSSTVDKKVYFFQSKCFAFSLVYFFIKRYCFREFNRFSYFFVITITLEFFLKICNALVKILKIFRNWFFPLF